MKVSGGGSACCLILSSRPFISYFLPSYNAGKITASISAVDYLPLKPLGFDCFAMLCCAVACCAVGYSKRRAHDERGGPIFGHLIMARFVAEACFAASRCSEVRSPDCFLHRCSLKEALKPLASSLMLLFWVGSPCRSQGSTLGRVTCGQLPSARHGSLICAA